MYKKKISSKKTNKSIILITNPPSRQTNRSRANPSTDTWTSTTLRNLVLKCETAKLTKLNTKKIVTNALSIRIYPVPKSYTEETWGLKFW